MFYFIGTFYSQNANHSLNIQFHRSFYRLITESEPGWRPLLADNQIYLLSHTVSNTSRQLVAPELHREFIEEVV